MKSWLIALVALILGAGTAVALTQGGGEDSAGASTAPTVTITEKAGEAEKKTKKKKDNKSTKEDEKQPAEQEVQQTVNAYVEALEQGDTGAVCDIQTQALSLEVTASGVSSQEIAEACAAAAEQYNWDELWAAWASQVDLDDVEVDINGGQAKVSLTGGSSLSLDRQRSGEWKVDGVKPSHQGPQATPTPQVPQSPDVPQRPQLPQVPQR